MTNNYIPLKLKSEIARIKSASILTATALDEIRKHVKVGVTTESVSKISLQILKKMKLEPGLLGYKGFPAPICISVNFIAAHGVPNNYILQNGDIVTLDLTAGKNGWFGDYAITMEIGEDVLPQKKKLIKSALKATNAGIMAAKAGCRMGDIGYAINSQAEKDGFKILKNFIGHGIGREIHEEPAVLNSGKIGTGQPVVPGMVFTIEPILTIGSEQVETLSDKWSVATKDRMPTAQFEHTIAIFSNHTEVLTKIEKS